MSKPRDPPINYDYMLGLTGFYEEDTSMYGHHGRTYKQKSDWIYLFPKKKKGKKMPNEEFTPIPVQNWDSSPKCPKCESEKDDLKLRWKNGATAPGTADTVNGQKYDLPEGFEHLLCECSKCGYGWIMQTADADERATAEKEAAEEKEHEKDDDTSPPVIARGHATRVVSGGA